jgi:murein DD-endopeptidase MepM/ murein hydrolase activator NlpD
MRRIARLVCGPRSKLATAIVLVPLLALLLASAAPVGAIQQPAGSSFRYSVQAGDTLWKLAIKYDTTVDALIAANRLKDPDLIRPGELLWIPGQQAQRAAAAVRRAATKPVFPIKGWRGRVGEHWGGFQGAADLMVPEGTPVLAVMGGRVMSAGLTEIGGWNIMIDGDDGLDYYYAHFRERPRFRAGEFVATGEVIGKSGNTGNSAAPHLHIAIGPEISSIGNTRGLRPGYGIGFDVSKFLNKLL